MYARKGSTLKVVLTLTAIALVICFGIGGTIAWLMAKTDPITNTFTTSGLSIQLTETVPTNKTAKMVPGEVIPKDPSVTVFAKSENCYVFVQIVKDNGFDSFMTFSVAQGWEPIADGSNVYYRTVTYSETDNQNFPILDGNQVIVSTDVTKEDMADLTTDDLPTLSFTAYAIQSANLGEKTIAQIWEMAKGNATT